MRGTPLLAIIIALCLNGGQGAARSILLNPPIACDLATICFIQNYMDRDLGPGAADFTCNRLSYDAHSGTDFALPTDAMMDQGVDVIAPAPGTVTAIRDGMPDQVQGTAGAPDITGKECGNGVVIDHGGGWETQLCHMKRGSIAVQTGQHVALGQRMGLVGLSGQTTFPHVHLSVRQDGKNVDPFHPDELLTCDDPPATSLWENAPAYRPGGLINAGFATEVPAFDAIKSGMPALSGLPATAPALVLWVHLFGSRAGDVVEIAITGPDGPLIVQRDVLEKPQARLFRAAGKKAPAGGWPQGRYSGTARLIRDGVELGRVAIEVASSR